MQQDFSAKQNYEQGAKAVSCTGQETLDRSSTSTEQSILNETQDIKDIRELKGALLEMID